MRKMMLVPPQGLPSPLLSKLSRLDEEMKAILDRTDLDQHTKVAEYSQVLNKYLETRNQYRQPVPVPLVERREVDKKEIDLEAVPSVYRKKAQLLARYMRDNQNIDWNDKNELIIDGATIPESNVIDLIDDLARPTTKTNPRGIDQLITTLKRDNTPHSIIGNKRRLTGSTAAVGPEPPLSLTPPPSPAVTKSTRVRRNKKQTGRGGKWSKW